MITAVSTNVTWTYTNDDDKEPKTEWELRTIPYERQRGIGQPYGIMEDALKYEAWLDAVLKLGVQGVQNFVDADGDPVQYSSTGRKGTPSDNFLGRIPWDVRVEIAFEVWSKSTLSPEQLKNSPGEPGSTASKVGTDQAL